MKKISMFISALCLMAMSCLTAFAEGDGATDDNIGSLIGEGDITMITALVSVIIAAAVLGAVIFKGKNK